MAWSKNGTTTLSSAGDDIDITSLTASEFNCLLMHFWGETDLVTPDMTLDNTGGNDYARRNSSNGGTDTTLTSQAFVENGLGGIPTNAWSFVIDYIINIDSEEKLGIGFCIAGSDGVTNAPSRSEFVWKKDTSTDTGQFTRIDINNTDAGNFATGSNLTALNGDTTEVAVLPTNLQSGSRFEATDTRKIYYGALPSVTFEDDFSGTDNWTDQGTKIAVNISTDVLDLDVIRDGSSYATVYDLGAGVVSNSWVLRWTENYSTVTTGSATPHHYIGLSSGDQTVGGRSNQESIVLRPIYTATGTRALYGTWTDSTHQPTNSPSGNSQVELLTPSTNTDYFYEIKRISSTEATFSRYSDSTYSTTVSSSTVTNLPSINNLRYLKIGNDNGASGAGQLIGTVDDVKFYNGVTSTDFTWTEEV